jgi:SAM-dependent methyltransferase
VLAVTAPWAADLVAAADPPPWARVLDVACGTGIVARLAAERVGPTGHVVGLDLNPGMLAVARHGAPQVAAIKRAEHALADADALQALLTVAGFRAVAVRTATLTVRLPSPQAYVQIQLTATPLATVAVDLHDTTRAALVQAVGLALQSYLGADGLAFPQEAHVAVAHP